MTYLPAIDTIEWKVEPSTLNVWERTNSNFGDYRLIRVPNGYVLEVWAYKLEINDWYMVTAILLEQAHR